MTELEILGTIGLINVCKYDSLQVYINGAWLDYSSIKTVEDFNYARRLMLHQWFGGHPQTKYAICRGYKQLIVSNGTSEGIVQ